LEPSIREFVDNIQNDHSSVPNANHDAGEKLRPGGHQLTSEQQRAYERELQ
jgi:hypothetical protein